MIDPRPASAAEAVQRALRLLADPSNTVTGYALSTGGYHPSVVGGKLIDLPWTQTSDASGTRLGCDCAGFAISWCYKLPRHRPGYNRGNPSGVDNYDVEDDLNSNSILGDAFGARDSFAIAEGNPQPGDLIAYPTFRLPAADGSGMLTFVGHVAIVVSTSYVGGVWSGNFADCDIAQVRGGEGRRPACVRTDGSLFDHHNATWPKEQHRAWLLRAQP